MKHKHYSEIEAKRVEIADVSGVVMRLAISREDGAPNFAMRMFHVEPGGHTPLHRHDFEHEVFVVDGMGELMTENGPRPLRTGDFVYVEPNALHQFRNVSDGELTFICVVPQA